MYNIKDGAQILYLQPKQLSKAWTQLTGNKELKKFEKLCVRSEEHVQLTSS